MRTFEFHAYHNGMGAADITVHEYEETSQAKAYAGRLAKRINGPVDVAFSDARPWGDRYITTSIPSEYHATGYRFERLD